MICDGKHYNLKIWPGLHFTLNFEDKIEQTYEFNDI